MNATSPGSIRCRTPCHLDVEQTFKEEEGLILTVVNMTTGPYAWLDDVFKDGLGPLCLCT